MGNEHKKIEIGQIYVIKPDSKHKNIPKAKIIKIDEYYKKSETEYDIENIWKIMIKNEEGDWISPEPKNLLFGQQILAHYNLEFNPLQKKISRLEDIEG